MLCLTCSITCISSNGINSRHKSTLTFSKLKVGDRIDCLDSSNRWAEAKIVEICKKSKQLLVSYLYWGSEWDEWVSDLACGIAPLKTHTYFAGGPLERGFRMEVLHDGVWREGFVMEKRGGKVSGSFCLLACVSAYLPTCLYYCCMPTYLPTGLSSCLPFCLLATVCLPLCLSAFRPTFLSLYLLSCVCLHLSALTAC